MVRFKDWVTIYFPGGASVRSVSALLSRLGSSGHQSMSLMMDEILEQPAALRRTLKAEREHALEFKRFAAKQNFRLIVLVARGTSDNAAIFGRYLLELTTGIPVSLAAPSVYTLYGAKLRLNRALVIGVSQSGEGEDINHVLDTARAGGAYTVGITNEAG